MTGRHRNPRGQGDLLRRDLVAAGLGLIRSAGSDGAVTVRAVARDAGVAPQSFYLHFPNVAALLREIYVELFSGLVQEVRAAAAAVDPDPPARLRAACLAYVAFAREHPGEYLLLFGTRGTREEWQEGLPGQALVTEFDALLRAVQAPSPGLTLATLWATLHGLATLPLTRPAFPWPATERLLDFALANLVPGPGESPTRDSGD